MTRLMIGYGVGYAMALAIIALLSGCSGLEGRVGLYRVDEMQGSQRTYKTPAIRCWFVTCPPVNNTQGTEVQGS